MKKQEFKDKLRQVIDERFGGNISRFAKTLGVRDTKIQMYLKQGSIPKVDFCYEMAKLSNVSIEWLLGKEDLPARRAVAHTIGEQDVYSIPIVEGGISAGTGALPENRIKGHLLVLKSSLKRAEPYDCRHIAVEVLGDSMEPELHEGDVIIVDRVDVDLKRLRRDSIYAVRTDGHVYAKRLRLDRKRRELQLISDNPDHTRQHGIERIALDDNDSHIIGRVVMSIRNWR